MSRNTEINGFLSNYGWSGAERQPIPGDASFRHYERIIDNSSGNKRRAILMDAPPEVEDVKPFLKVLCYLSSKQYTVPEVIAADGKSGLLLLSDLGSVSFSKGVADEPELEEDFYHAAIDALVSMHEDGVERAKEDNIITSYDKELLMKEVSLLGEWLLPALLDEEEALKAADEFNQLVAGVIDAKDILPQVVVHRDYHADNLFWIADKKGMQRVGMIDFQDAVLGRSAYDMVSLLEDARRDVSPKVVASSLRRYLSKTGQGRDEFMADYSFYGMQRNAKILGIFTRLLVRDGKDAYLEYMPRVWRLFLNDIEHGDMIEIKKWREKYLPDDKAETLLNPDKLKEAILCQVV